MKTPGTLATLPFDVLLNVASFIEVEDFLALNQCNRALHDFAQTRAIWRTFAKALFLRGMPLAIPGFETPAQLPHTALMRHTLRARRIERNWSAAAPRFLRVSYATPDSAGGNIDWITPVTADQVIVTTLENSVILWDTGRNAAMGCYQKEDTWILHKCRVVYEERTVYLIMGDTSDPACAEYKMVRVAYPSDDEIARGTQASFTDLTSFKIPGVAVFNIYLVSVPLRTVCVFCQPPGYTTLALYVVFDWLSGQAVFVDTQIPCNATSALSTTCTLWDDETLLVYTEDGTAATEYQFSTTHLRTLASAHPPALPFPLAPRAPTSTLPFHGTVPDRASYDVQAPQFIRQWWPSLGTIPPQTCALVHLERTVPAPAGDDGDGDNNNVNNNNNAARESLFEQHYYGDPLAAPHVHRWYTPAAFRIASSPPLFADEPARTLYAVDFSYAVWIESRAEALGARLMLARFPRADSERGAASTDAHVCELECPKEIDLNDVNYVSVDASQGTVTLCLHDGRLAMLHYA